MSMQPSGQQYIGGARCAAGSTVLHSVDARTGERLPYAFHEATVDEVDAAARAAAAAYPAFRALAPEQRARFLDAAADGIDALGEDFIGLVCRETGLPSARIAGERARTSHQLRLFAAVLRRGDFLGARIDLAMPQRSPLPRADLRQYRIGVGPVAVFGASNFPLAFSTAGGDTASALAAGCPVVFKAHTGHMATASVIADVMVRAAEATGMPRGVFNMIFGDRVGEHLVRHAEIRAVGFTGSLRGGRALCDMAAARPHPIPVFAEMSSVNPVILMPHALARRRAAIAAELAASVTLGAGQFCTNPGLILGIRSSALDVFVEHFKASISAAPAQTMLNAAGLQHYEAGVRRFADTPGMALLAAAPSQPGQASAELWQADAALLFQPEGRLQQEVFGPCTVLVELDDAAQLQRAIDALQGQLTATLIAEPEDLADAAPLVAALEHKAGRLLVNSYPTGVEVCDAMVHGGPYPATSDARGTSVGTLAIDRFLRPVCFQNLDDALLPAALQNANPLGIDRLVNGARTRGPIVG
ncbi:NADP-dependent aldehyde dehydrogenase [Cupriavidus sp. YR651]|uniref:aldehyde dehydrogenase (NADP(+)) n=1 Tax=Cupriavidus sp. YR651 TaxID=1855315 RepID=UPI00087EDBF5|nr:aldehyde dehydrogenase (NADP(+)) [Cupriavidus sp. YR651]SDC73202.1 NADP-dependent aldehyde dehydrogenase [Cupriavidus sp. YR651]